jgi:hypothetical protein
MSTPKVIMLRLTNDNDELSMEEFEQLCVQATADRSTFKNANVMNRYWIIDGVMSFQPPEPKEMEMVSCDACQATSESGWGDTEFCLECSLPVGVAL